MNSAQIIDALGGPAKVAELLGIADKPGSVQRVWNWKTRGIPPRVLLDHPDVFQTQQPEPTPAGADHG